MNAASHMGRHASARPRAASSAGLAPDAPRRRDAARPPASSGRRADPGVGAGALQAIEQVVGISDDRVRRLRRAAVPRSDHRRRALARAPRRLHRPRSPDMRQRGPRRDHRPELDDRADGAPAIAAWRGIAGVEVHRRARAEPLDSRPLASSRPGRRSRSSTGSPAKRSSRTTTPGPSFRTARTSSRRRFGGARWAPRLTCPVDAPTEGRWVDVNLTRRSPPPMRAGRPSGAR